MMRTLSILVLLIGSVQLRAQDDATIYQYKLWYDSPANQWEEALPVGNGRFGGMVFGRAVSERIQFNEDTVWEGFPTDYSRPGAVEVLPEIRRLLREGNQQRAHEVAQVRFMSVPLRQRAYQAFGDLMLTFTGVDSTRITNYRRELDLGTATATTTFEHGGVTHTREVFTSYPDQVMVVHLGVSEPGNLSLEASLDSPHEFAYIRMAAGNQLSMLGRIDPGGIIFEARLAVRTSGGTVSFEDGKVQITDADAATLLLTGATNYVSYDDLSGVPEERNDRVLVAVETLTLDDLRRRHLADHQELFNRVSINLGTSQDGLPTDERILQFREGEDPGLAALLFQYGRYLLIASSRQGSQPANLQGIWNDKNDPPWESKWTVNINTEMNYWPAEMTNLAECHLPLFDLIEDVAETGRVTAEEHYGARGWVLHHNTDIWRGTAPINHANHGIWLTGGAWLTQHLWWHYLYGGDLEFLENRAYPILRDASLFFLDVLEEDPETGNLVSGPSNSPEIGGLVIGPTMDHQIIRELFNNTLDAGELLGEEEEFMSQVRAARDSLASNRIGQHGQLQEWMEDRDDPDETHRHVSHLWGLHPGTEINMFDTPRWYEAAEQSLRFRGDGGTGWSMAWKINFWARLHDGDHAYRMLENLLTLTGNELTEYDGGGVYANLFDAHPPFQIDGNFGATSGIVEMFVQSFDNLLHFAPAVPSAWPRGRITGLRARGGITIEEMIWDMNQQFVEVTLRSMKTQDMTLLAGAAIRGMDVSYAVAERESERIEDAVLVSLPAGQPVTFLIRFDKIETE